MRSLPGALLILASLACSGGEGGDLPSARDDADVAPVADVDPDACAFPGRRDADGPAADLPAVDAPSSCALPDLTGRFYRFSRFDVDRPAGPEDALAATLTSLWAAQIAADQLNITFHVVRHDAATGDLDLEAGTAVRLPDGGGARYRMVSDPPPGVLPVRLEGCRFRSRAAGALVVFPDLLTVPIEILDTWIQGAFTADGGAIEQASMAGGICRDMAKAQYFKLVPEMSGCSNLYGFMTDVGVDPDRADLPCGPCSGAGYTFVGRFDAPSRDDYAAQAAPAPHEFRCE